MITAPRMRSLIHAVCAASLAAAVVQGIWAQEQPSAGFPLTPPDRFVTAVDTSEDTQSAATKSIKATFLDGIRRFDWDAAGEALTDDFRGRFPRPDQGRPIADDRLIIREFTPASLAVLDADKLLAALRSHTEKWTSVDRAAWQVFEFLLSPRGDQAFASVHLQLGGPGRSAERGLLDATVRVRLRRVDERWLIEMLDLVDATRIDNPLPPFRDITDAVGFHFNRSEANSVLRQRIIDTGGSLIDSALTVLDWNDDGFWDVLATQSMNQIALFVNDGKGGFVRGALPVTDRRLIPSQALFVDLDGDGHAELVGNRASYQGDWGWMGIYTRRDGQWVHLPRALPFANPRGVTRNDAQQMTAGDVNGDGRLDLFVGGYETSASRDRSRFNLVDADDGADNLLFINQGNLQFTEESDQRGIVGTRYTYVVHAFDFDEDGDLDLFEGNDYGRNVVWDNQGDGTFLAQADHPLARDIANTMGVAVGDWNNTGQWSVYLSNMYSHAGNRVVRLNQDLGDDMREQLELLAAGNQLFTQTGDGSSWREDAVERHVNFAEWAWGCLFVDIDNDGDQEIFVTNGNTSVEDPEAPDF